MSAAFDVVFGVFVLSMIVIAVVAVRWGRQRDRLSRSRRDTGGPPSPHPGETWPTP